MNNLVILSSLFWADFLSLVRWFKTAFIGKAVVSSLFVFLFAFIGLFIYLSSYNFLLPLTGYEIYGQMTALYLVHASVIVTLWLGIGSSLAATYTFMVSHSPDLDTVLTNPVRPFVLVLRLFIRSLFSSLFWSLVIFFPLGLAVYRIFALDQSGSYFFLFFLISLVVTTCAVLGSLLAFILARFHRSGRPYLYGPLLAIIYIFATLILIRYLFPQDFSRLYSASAEEFLVIFARLPLNQFSLPSLSLAKLLFGVWSASLFPITAGLIIFTVFTLLYQGRRLIPLRQKLSGGQTISFTSKKVMPFFYSKDLSLTAKDIFSILRSPSELGYTLFLLFLVLGFFFFLSGSIRAITDPNRLSQIAIFAFSWLLFYAIAYLMRLVFPLMAKEGRTAWLLFTLPLRPGQILNQKIFASLVLSFPLFVLGLFLWPILGVGQYLIHSAVYILLYFTVFTTLFGSLFPNFREAASPERVSTSLMGITTLVTLLGLSFVFINRIALFPLSPQNFFIMVFVSLLSLVLVKYISIQAVSRYRF